MWIGFVSYRKGFLPVTHIHDIKMITGPNIGIPDVSECIANDS